ncbi:MAG: RNA polymerase sigma factor [Verrucomicrobia subdivision 3 bacterium]|nr:RNA polymerase sigma factor [Limisphaerales bacterium]
MSESPSANAPVGSSGYFATTHWSVVLLAADGTSSQSEAALESLCRTYWYPLYAYVRRCGHDPEEAKDLTQAFFARLIEKKQLATVERGKGKFRSWLLGVMKHFLAHEWVKGRAQKRGSGQPVFSLDEVDPEERYRLEPATDWTAEKIFDRRWALTVLDAAASRLQREYEAEGNASLYAGIKGFVSSADEEVSYAQAAQRLGLSLSAVKSAIFRVRVRYQELIRAEIAQTVANAAEVDEEIRYLLEVLRD